MSRGAAILYAAAMAPELRRPASTPWRGTTVQRYNWRGPTREISRIAVNTADLRRNFMQAGLDERSAAADPIKQFERWFDAAAAAGLHLPNAVILATADAQGAPSARAVLLKDYGLSEPGLSKVIRAGYDLLGLETFFTAGPKEVRAWTIHKGDRAPQAAGVIHTDFEKGFIRAEIYFCDDLFAHKTEAAIKDAGLLRQEGKEYVMKDGDVVHFKFNV